MELLIVLSFCSLLFSNVYGIRVSQQKCDEYRKMRRPRTSEEFNDNDKDAALNEFPFMSKISNGTHSCNGILISENFVLSSATCDKLGNKQITLGYSGGESREDVAQSQRLDVINEFVYQKFSRYDRSFNIKLLQLNESVKFNEYIQPACLPQSRSTNSQQFIEGHTGAALLSNDSFDEIQGISSVGFRCNSTIPVIFVRLSAYIDWIENIVWPIDITTTKSDESATEMVTDSPNGGANNSFQLKNIEIFFITICVFFVKISQ